MEYSKSRSRWAPSSLAVRAERATPHDLASPVTRDAPEQQRGPLSTRLNHPVVVLDLDLSRRDDDAVHEGVGLEHDVQISLLDEGHPVLQ